MAQPNDTNLPPENSDEGVDIEVFLDNDELDPPRKPKRKETKKTDAPTEAQEQPTSASKTAKPKNAPKTADAPRGYTKLELFLVALLAICLVIIVKQSGGTAAAPSGELPKGHPDISAMGGNFTMGDGQTNPHGTSPQIDEKKVAELKKAIEADPKALAPRLELGKLYFDATFYQDASLQFEQALKLDPENMELLLIAGVSAFNINDFTTAERHWKKATQIDPQQAEPWYNLGYVYLMAKPVNEAELKAVWDKVLELAPDSDMAADIKKYREQAPGPVTETKK